MITRTQISFSVSGPRFSPRSHELPWTKINTIPSEGNNWGTVDYDLDEFADQENAIRVLHEHFRTRIPVLRRSGATSFDLSISWTYEDQCAGGFTNEEMKWISDLECSLSIDCNKVDSNVKPKNAEQIAAARPGSAP